MNQEQWNQETKKQEVSVTEMQDLILAYAAAREDYDSKKSIASAANAEVDRIKAEIIEKMKGAGLDKFSTQVGTVSTTHKLSVTTPKTLEDKKALAEYFKAKGEDFFYSYMGINSQTLNSYYNEMSKDAAARGETFSLPGIGEPTVMENISFRKGK
jgi:RecG-like helicase